MQLVSLLRFGSRLYQALSNSGLKSKDPPRPRNAGALCTRPSNNNRVKTFSFERVYPLPAQLWSLFNLAEVADGPTQLSFKKDISHTLSIKANEKSRQRLNCSEGEISQPSDDAKSANQEEIIALFRRIQSSISKGDSTYAPPKRRNASNPSRDNYKPSTESVIEILRQSRKQDKGEQSMKKVVNKVIAPKEILQKEVVELEHEPLVTDFKITRPPSNFAKKSPIQSLYISREKVVEQSNATVAPEETKSKRVEDMKVMELKELAKSRGLKAYSKLKKHELIEWLKSS